MRYNCILDAPPSEYGGVKVKTDFKQVLKFFRVMDAPELDEREKAGEVLGLFFDMPPLDSSDLWEFLEFFISGGEKNGSGGSDEKLFDFNVDHGRLYAAFMQTYGIDLRAAAMHWWVFLELFRAIPEGTTMMSVVDLRGKKIPAKGDRDYIRKLRKAKRAFAIEPEREAEKSIEKIKGMLFSIR